ncbi:MAG: TldD/PmbA family protein [Alphaproteobacteria bacterium]|jgi:PmbA protein|nr:TldD/PmbA family protein [Alphaproteobacteria bacterium]
MAKPFDPEAVVDAALTWARRCGAEAAEASIAFGESQSVEVRLGRLEGVERDESRSLALRAFIGKRQAGAAVTDLSPAGVRALAERVASMAKLAPEDPFCGLLDPAYRVKSLKALDIEDTARPSAVSLEEDALACEHAALAVDGVANSNGASASYGVSGYMIATSDGFRGRSSGTSYSLGVAPIAEKNGSKERDYESATRRFYSDLPKAAAIGAIAGARAVRRLGARKIKSQTAPVLFEARLAGRIIGPILGAINGAAVARGVSFLKDKLGRQILPDAFTLTEDPFKRRGLASRAFDGEGGAVRKRAIIENGVLKTWLLNSATARQLRLKPTGHATVGHGGPPGAAPSNLAVSPGQGSLADLMRQAGKGLVVTEMFSPALNANTGDWSVGVSGYWFVKGEAAHPVHEVTVAGNLLDLYPRLICGEDLEERGGLTAPSLMLDRLSIGGA